MSIVVVTINTVIFFKKMLQPHQNLTITWSHKHWTPPTICHCFLLLSLKKKINLPSSFFLKHPVSFWEVAQTWGKAFAWGSITSLTAYWHYFLILNESDLRHALSEVTAFCLSIAFVLYSFVRCWMFSAGCVMPELFHIKNMERCDYYFIL